jgi:hypothetical protein
MAATMRDSVRARQALDSRGPSSRFRASEQAGGKQTKRLGEPGSSAASPGDDSRPADSSHRDDAVGAAGRDHGVEVQIREAYGDHSAIKNGAAPMSGYDFADEFEFGLDLILDGLEGLRNAH